jgi:hypothetical protein
MGWFSKRATPCPICGMAIEKNSTLRHWNTHVSQIPPGHGEASGQYTWQCVCGPAGLKWPTDFAASSGLAMHMHNRHGIPIGS